MDLATGKFERLTTDLNLAFDVGGGLPRFDSKGGLLVLTTDKSYKKLARLNPKKDWAVELIELSGESLGSLAVSPDGGGLLFSASSTSDPGSLYSAETGGKSRLLESFAAGWDENWLWSEPVEASFVGTGGVEIEAWFYPPLQHSRGG